jgi:hypothetical protein
LPQAQRLERLNQIAIQQMHILTADERPKSIANTPEASED